VVPVEFPTPPQVIAYVKAQALYNSAEYKEAQKIGNKYATFRRYAVEGLMRFILID